MPRTFAPVICCDSEYSDRCLTCMRIGLFIAAAVAAAAALGANGSTLAIDNYGNIWRTGQTSSLTTTANAYQSSAVTTACATQQLSPFDQPTTVYCPHVFLSKQDVSGNIVYATYLSGDSADAGTAITTDAAGNVYVTGYTFSDNFPTTPGALQTKNAGPLTPVRINEGLGPFGPIAIGAGGDVFVAKFAPNGTLAYSTLLGGSGQDVPTLIQVDASGNVFVAGTTTSTNFPVTQDALMGQTKNGYFFAELNAQASAVLYATYSDSSIQSFDIDSAGHAFLTGFAQISLSSVGPYVTGIDTSTGGLMYSIFLPSLNSKFLEDSGAAITVTTSGTVWLAVSPAPQPANAPVPSPPVYALGNSYLLQLSPDGSRIPSETDIGSTQFDSVLVDSSGNAYALGHGTGTLPASPITPLLAQPCSAQGEPFVLEVMPSGSVAAATYLRQGGNAGARLTAPSELTLYRGISNSTISLDLTSVPALNFGCPVNLASGVVGQGLAPGEIFSITGSNIGPAQPAVGAPSSSGLYPTSLGGAQVTLNGSPVPLLMTQAGEIHAVAPFGLLTTATLQIEYNGKTAPPLDVPETDYDPGILMVNGQAAVINQDGTVNTPSNPAKLGSIISIYATGLGTLATSNEVGATINPLPDGAVAPIPPPYYFLFDPPQVTIGGVQCKVLFAGAAPGIIAGVEQLNVQLPAALPSNINPAAAPLVLNPPGAFSLPAPVSVAP